MATKPASARRGSPYSSGDDGDARSRHVKYRERVIIATGGGALFTSLAGLIWGATSIPALLFAAVGCVLGYYVSDR